MEKYWHSVTLEKDLCKGCTNCLKLCPTQAIRVQGGKAKILKERCIDCGECIRVCPYHAKKAVTDDFSILDNYKYKIALIAPAFYGQFSVAEDVNVILTAVTESGFDDVFEVAWGARVISEKTRELISSGELLTPSISSACPTVLRLIAVKFPNLVGNIIPLRSPMEVSAEEARKRAAEKTGLNPSEIGVFFISPCAAKATAVKDLMTVNESQVSGVFSMKDLFLRIAKKVGKVSEPKIFDLAGREGIKWATSGGEGEATGVKKYVAVDGIHNVIKVLEAIEDGKLNDVEFVETLACTGGCVGGPLTAENNFVSRSRLERICEKTPNSENIKITGCANCFWDEPVVYRPVMNLDDDIGRAMEKMAEIEDLYEKLPKLDCGSCGSPSCRALAEDIVRGYAQENDCIFILKEKIKDLAREMVQLDDSIGRNQ